MIFLGVDGGATQTRCVGLSPEGILGPVVSDASNLHGKGVKASARQLTRLVRAIVPRSPSSEVVAAACISGVDTDHAKREIMWALAKSLPGVLWTVENDSLAAWKGAFWGQPQGVVVIAGTGAVAYARGEDGHSARAGGWGPLLNDEGSAYDLGRRGLSAVLHARDGTAPPTSLSEAILARLGLTAPEEIIDHVHFKMRLPQDIAHLARVVVQEAKLGDQIAMEIVRTAARALVHLALAAARSAAGSDHAPIPCSLVGGLGANPIFRSEVRQHIEQKRPVRWQEPIASPLTGALILAIQTYAKDGGEERLARLRQYLGVAGLTLRLEE